MNYQDYSNKLKNKLILDQNKLKDKKQELSKLNEELILIKDKCLEREQLNVQINEKIKLIEQLFKRIKSNFNEFPEQITDLDLYLKQVLQNKHKFEVPIDQFEKSLENSFAKLNKKINDKVDYIKLKFKEIIDKLEIKKASSVRLMNESLIRYEQLKSDVQIENENIVKLEEEIRIKQDLVQEYKIKINELNELNKQVESKTESISKENQEINKEITNLNALIQKSKEDEKLIRSKIEMQNELIDCTKLLIEELENNTNSNLNYQKYKDEYEQVEQQIKKLEQEYDDRSKIYEMEKQCKELKEKKIDQINKIIYSFKLIESKEELTEDERNKQYESIIAQIQTEIKYLENELDEKGLLSQMNHNQQLDNDQANESDSSKLQLDDDLNASQKLKIIDNENKFDFVPEELLDYVYDDEAILFEESQVDSEELFDDSEIIEGEDKENTIYTDQTKLKEDLTGSDNLKDLNNSVNENLNDSLNDDLNESSDDFNKFTSPIIPNKLFGHDTSNQSTQFTLNLSGLLKESSTKKQRSESEANISSSSSLINRSLIEKSSELTSQSPNLANSSEISQFKTPGNIKNNDYFAETKGDKRKEKHLDDNQDLERVKRQRQN